MIKKIFLSSLFIFTLLITTFLNFNTVSASACTTLNSNIAIGSIDAHYSTPDVTTLQNFLISKGFLTTPASGTFGLQTQAAAKSFQANNGLEATGFVGPLTRGKIKDISCGTNTTPTLPVVQVPTISTTTISSSSGMSIRDFVNLLIMIGIIPPERIPAINIFLASLGASPVSITTPTTSTTTATTTAIVTVTRGSSGGGGGGGSSSRNYTVTFDPNGGTGSMTSQTIRSGSSASLTTNSLTRTGYIFSGWNTLADGTGTDYADSASYSMGSGNVTLYAVWVRTYTVTYYANGGVFEAVGETQTYEYSTGATTTIKDANGFGDIFGNLLRFDADIDFIGWNTAADGSGTDYATSSIITVTDNINLYAVWRASVTYDPNGATSGVVPVGVNFYFLGSTTTVLNNSGSLAVEGCATFSGWNTEIDGTGTSSAPSSILTIDGNTTLYAQWTPTAFAGGDGLSTSTAYQIDNWTLLSCVRNSLTSNYILTADLSSTTSDYPGLGNNWTPIGQSAVFSGEFNGAGHFISDLTISTSSVPDYAGLFGRVEFGNISNLGVINLNINIPGVRETGGLVGALTSGTISNSYSVGNITGNNYTGGLVGALTSGTISNSYSMGTVDGRFDVGGLVGLSNNATSINNSYGAMYVVPGYHRGGLVGLTVGSAPTNSFWDADVSGIAGGTTTVAMKTPATFIDAGWSESIWNFVEGEYPTLR